MGLFSFGNKDASATSGRGNSASGAASGRASRRAERSERQEAGEGLRRRRRGEPADANMLDPTLPEKQRARRRLIGAIALVLAAVVILPMVLDSHPKPATDGIAIEIPAHDDTPAPAAPSQSSTTAYEAAAGDRDDDTGPAAATDTGTGNTTAALPAAPGAKGTPNDSSKTTAKSAGSANATNSAKPVNAPGSTRSTAAANSAGTPADKADASKADAAASQKTTAAKAPTANDAPPAGSHFVIQIGSFAADAPAQAWVTKLKAAGVPAYVQHSRQDDGSDRVLVRAGPFTDRAAAEVAVRKVRAVDAPEDAGASPASH
jgi:DedD protein